jgi:hypothetical protein
MTVKVNGKNLKSKTFKKETARIRIFCFCMVGRSSVINFYMINGVPDRRAFTVRERRLIEHLRTPLQVQRFLRKMPYNWEKDGETLRTFREVLRCGQAHCLEAALAAAVILEQHAYPPLLLSLESQDKLDHVVFVFRHNGMWGAIGRSRDLGLHGRRPIFRNLRQLAWSYFDTYIDETGRITGYGVANLYDLGDYDWRFAAKNVWKVERFLCEIPHRKIISSDQRYERLRARYRDWKSRYPKKPLTDYASRAQWML